MPPLAPVERRKKCYASVWGKFCVRLTAFDGVGSSLQWHRPAIGLVDVHSEYQSHARVFTADVRLPFAELDVGVAQLEDPRTINSERERQQSRT